jgi:hypothetical protein
LNLLPASSGGFYSQTAGGNLLAVLTRLGFLEVFAPANFGQNTVLLHPAIKASEHSLEVFSVICHDDI